MNRILRSIPRPTVCHVRVILDVRKYDVTVSILPASSSVHKIEIPPVSMSVQHVTLPRKKALAKKNEEQDILYIVEMLNDASHVKGMELRRLYHEAFPGRRFLRASLTSPYEKKKAGSRSAHYDFYIQIQEPDGETKWLTVEHKGSAMYRPLHDEMPPWTGGVQFFNGGMEKYRLCHRYAEAWYARYVGSGWLSTEYELKEPIPSCEEWIQRDARVQGDPKTPWGKALKRAVKAGGRESLLYLRNEFVPDFMTSLTETDYQDFLEDVTPILRDSFKQKDVWLQIAGNVESSFYSRWSPGLSLTQVTGIHFDSCKKDITGQIESDSVYPIRFILRWGKGAGFSNLRLDLK